MNPSASDPATLLDAVRAAMADADNALSPFSRVVGLRYLSITPGHCSAELTPRPHHGNAVGIAHGGVLFTLADSACGAAAFAALGAPRIVTQDLHIRYHNRTEIDPAGPPLRATAEVVHHGTRTIVTHCRIAQGERLVATADGTFAILPAP